ncbi:MAG: N-acetylglucosamine-6-phosphate deacetylase [Bacteroidales bacterium]
MLKVLTGARVFDGNRFIDRKSVIINGKQIVDILNDEDIPSGSEIIRLDGLNISPGFIDLQIAGGAGLLFSSHANPDAITRISESIASTGTTSFLLVLPTNSDDVYRAAIAAAKKANHPAFLGLHLEGPWISKEKRGAHVNEFISIPDKSYLESLLAGSDGCVRMVTVAPEKCDEEFIKLLIANKIVICAGHSNCTSQEASKGFEMGITSVTHLFNAMSGFHHRETGLPGAVFQSETACSSIVVDGIHVSYDAISIAKKLLGPRLFLVSDAVEENHSGAYQHIRKGDRFTLADGTLSGSSLTMMLAVENCVRKAGIAIEEAIRMATSYPAGLMGLNDRGIIAPGYRADIVAFNKEFEVKKVFIEGKQV